MKKILYILCVVSLIFASCEKEEEQVCNCGEITADDILANDCYSFTIRNDCSGNYETFCFDYDVWFNNYVGDDFCVTNVDSW